MTLCAYDVDCEDVLVPANHSADRERRAVLTPAEKVASGQATEWNEELVDPRYRFRAAAGDAVRKLASRKPAGSIQPTGQVRHGVWWRSLGLCPIHRLVPAIALVAKRPERSSVCWTTPAPSPRPP
jgi:hypothetical protein